jgi:hypothetical protein
LTTPTGRRGELPRPQAVMSPHGRVRLAAVPVRPARRRLAAPRPGPRSENDLNFLVTVLVRCHDHTAKITLLEGAPRGPGPKARTSPCPCLPY